MVPEKINKLSDLSKRVNYFLSSTKFGRGEVKRLLDQLQKLGPVAIFGGMLRDLSIVGNEGFHSDIDLVIDTEQAFALDQLLQSYSAVRNNFGGYRLTLSQWRVDVWQLQSTWAVAAGYVRGDSLADLCHTTFFDWDGIVYQVGSRNLFTIDGYLERIHSGVLDISLAANPTPTGNIVKAFRYHEKYSANFSNRLARYIYENLESFDSELIGLCERKSHQRPILN